MKHVALSELQVGQSGTIVRLEACGGARHRLLEMGLVRGERIQMVRCAPLGDPVEYSIKDYRLSMRRREAASILVEVPLG